MKERVAGDPLLMLGVTTIFDDRGRKCVCSLRLEFTQTVRLDRNPGYVVFGVPTWSVGRVGIYTNRWREEMIEDVNSLTDEFIDDTIEQTPSPEGKTLARLFRWFRQRCQRLNGESGDEARLARGL